MNQENPASQNLEELIAKLASAIQNYPETDEAYVYELARKADETSVRGRKQESKDDLLNKLGYDTSDYKITSSFQTISESIIYLLDLGVNDIGKVVTRLPQVLSLSIDTMKPRV